MPLFLRFPALRRRPASLVLSILLALLLPGLAATLPSGFIEQPVGSGWSNPVGIAFDTSGPNDRLYVWERAGKIWIVENGSKLATPLVDISEEVMAWRDFGLLGVALDPRFQQNGYIYLLYVVDRHHLLYFGTAQYNAATNLNTAPTIGRLARYTARASDGFRSVDPASRRVLVGEAINKGFPILHESHGVGSLVFGTDGTLLAACGDAASYNAMDDGGPDGGSLAAQALTDGIITTKEDVGAFRAQLPDSLNGKIIRIDPATGDGIASNPYFDTANPRSAKSRVWTLGLRNPYRMTVRPSTGAHDPTAANPGTIYLGDVGWTLWEDFHVITGPGKNCGWPLYEGLEAHTQYQASPAVNLDAPNPLGGYFRFKDLLIQDTLAAPSWPNPANAAQQVPTNIPKWLHTRPILDYKHGADIARTGTFSGNNATTSTLGTAGCPVAGASFRGNAATGGVFFTTEDFPEMYHGTYFGADYGAQWIKSIRIGEGDRPGEVQPFASATGPIVFLTTHPSAGGLYYVNFDGNIRRIVYAPGGNQQPVAAASAAPNFGPSPLTVQFSGAGSYDPEGTALNYLWAFDDGTTSTQPNPAKTFTATGTRKFNVTLTVTDAGGAADTISVPVFANHAPPGVVVTSPVDGAKYPVGATSTFPLEATITPQPGHVATSTWQTILHHDNHTHMDAPLAGPNASVTIGGEGAGFFYENVLTVTDDLGLTVTRTVNLLPNLTNTAPLAAWSITSKQVAVGTATVLDAAATASDADSPGLDGGELRVQLVSGTASESLNIRNEGSAAGQVGTSGPGVTFGGVEVGTISGSASLLIVTFNTAATPAAAQAVLRNVTYLSLVGRSTPRTVRVTLSDGDGGTSAESDLGVTATAGNLKPLVQVTSPAAGALFTAPATVAITADASDPDGTIARVDFYRGSKKISSDTLPPYEATWTNAPAGTHYLRARAVDNSGGVTWSARVSIRVTAASTTLLADDFDDNSRDAAKWSLGTVAGTIYSGAAAHDTAIALAERNQRLEIPLRTGVSGDRYNGYLATTARDFTDASASVEVVQVAAGFADTMFAVSKDAANLVLMVVEGGDLYLDHIAGGVRNITGLAFNPVQHRHWRIRHVAESPAKICFEASADGVNWQTLRRDNASFAVTALRPEISAGTWQPESAPGMAVFENFNMQRGETEPPPPANEAPIADPGGPYTGVAGQPIALSAAESIDFDGSITAFAWDFADGSTGTGQDVSKIYGAAGTYTVLLRVTDDLGAFSEETTTVTVTAPVNQAPVSRPGGPYSGMAGSGVAFNGAASSDPDGTITGYAWSFGDGSTATGATPSHAYASAGTFTVSLTVTDNAGATHTASTTATIASLPVNQPPVANPSGPYTSTVGSAVAFNGAASSDADGTITSYAWNFGNGSTATGATPSHAYASAGTFTVSLTVTDNAGATHTASTTATISTPSPTVLLADDFDDNARDTAKWQFGAILGTIYSGAAGNDPLVQALERNARLEIVPRTGVSGDHYHGYLSAPLDLTGANVSVRVVQTAGGEADTFLTIGTDGQNFAAMGAEGGYLFFDQVVSGQRSVSIMSYQPAVHRHWRIRHATANDTLVFESSADGAAWTTLRTSPRQLLLGAARIELGAGTWQPESAPGTAIFDDLRAQR